MTTEAIKATTLVSIGDAIDSLHDVAALIECAESQITNDLRGNPSIRALRVANDKLIAAINYFDLMDIEAV